MATKNLKKQNKPGPAGLLTTKLTLQIRKLYLSGKKIGEIQEQLNIKPTTWDQWMFQNRKDFRTNFVNWRREKMLGQAELNLEEFSTMPTEVEEIEDSDEEDGPRSVVRTDPRLVKIKLDATTYITDTIGKEVYSKKVIQEDPQAAKKEEVESLRSAVKKLMSNQRSKYLSNHKVKMAGALK